MNRVGQPQIQIPTAARLFTPGASVILTLSVLGFAVAMFAPEFTRSWLVLNPHQAIRGKIWMLLTYPFITPQAWILIFDLGVILFIGSALEREWGTKLFLLLWIITAGLCGLIWTGVGLLPERVPLGFGSGACCYALIAAFGLVFHGRRFLLLMTTVDAQVLALLMIGISILLSLFPPINLIWILGAVIGYAFVKGRDRLSSTLAKPWHRKKTYRPGGFVDVD